MTPQTHILPNMGLTGSVVATSLRRYRANLTDG